MKQTLERELKLAVPPTFRLPAIAGTRLRPKTLTSTYFDTADYRLAKVGITLRRRVQGKHGVWQLKLPASSARREIEHPGGPNAPPDTLMRLLVAIVRGRDLVPIARLRTRRGGVRVMENGKPVAEVVVDGVAVLDGNQVVRRFSELEVELVEAGEESTLLRLEKELKAAGAQDTDPRPKVFKALDLAFPLSMDQPSPSDPPEEHLKRILQQQRQVLLAHDPGVRMGTDPEDVHQMRVTTRRLRAFLKAGRCMLQSEWQEKLREEIGWLGQELGKVRDFDVMIKRLRAEFSTLLLPERGALSNVIRRLEPDGAKARDEMMEALNGDRYLQILDQIEEPRMLPGAPAVPLHDIAAAEFKKLCRVVKAEDRAPAPDRMHCIRIKAKRARYAAELAQRAVGKRAERFIEQSKRFQDLLGDHQDATVIEKRLRELLSGTKGALGIFTLGRLVERQAAYRQEAREAFADAWKRLKKRGRRAWG